MAKKQVAVSLRKPPPQAAESKTSASPEATAGAPAVPTASVSLTTHGADVSTRLGQCREVTVLLPIDLARKLAVRCLETERDTNAFVADILAKALESEPAAARDVVTITVSGTAWARIRTRIVELTSWLPWGPLVRPQHV